MSRQTRRTFLKHAAVAGIAATVTIAGTKASGRVLGANDTVRVGVAGINGRGSDHIQGCVQDQGRPDHLPDRSRQPSVQGPALHGREARRQRAPSACRTSARRWRTRTSTPSRSPARNHWHSLMTIWACQAGKDVYVEKPFSHNVFEGRKCVEAARKYERIVQHGTQQRSDVEAGPGDRRRARGQVRQAAGLQGLRLQAAVEHRLRSRSKTRPRSWTSTSGSAPRPKQPFHRNLVHYNWHWFWDTGNGEIGNQGVHQMDVARWAHQGRARCPRSVWSLGGRFGYQGPGPDAQHAIGRLSSSATYTWCSRSAAWWATISRVLRPKVTNEFYTSEGVVQDGKFYPNSGGKTYDVKVEPIPITPGDCFGSFIHCVRIAEAGGGQRRDPRRPLLRRAVPPGQHLLPAGQGTCRSARSRGPERTRRSPRVSRRSRRT